MQVDTHAWTQAIHSPDGASLGLAPSHDPSVTFPAGEDGLDGEYIYGRTCHPTGDACASALAKMEGAEACLTTNSGMAAISTVLLALLKSGDHVVAPNIMYQPTRSLLGSLLSKNGIEVTFVDARSGESYTAAQRKNTKLAWIETPANPTLDLTDFQAVANWAQGSGILTVADNTFSTPMGSLPLSWGIDIVVHSATKFLAGHGDLLAGAILTRTDLKNRILPWLDHLGSALNAHGAWLLRRGIGTFPLRYERHQANAIFVAEWLLTQSKVTQVHYPGLLSHPQRGTFLKQMKGGGGVLSFEIDGDEDTVMKFLCGLRLCAIARSLGEPRSLVAHPWSMHYKALDDLQRQQAGIPKTLVRLAVGLEDPSDICSDLASALADI